MIYQVTIGDRVVEVNLKGSTPTVNGRPVTAELVNVPGSPVRHLIVDGRSHTFVVSGGPRTGEWRMTLDGRPFDAIALDERTRVLLELSGGAETEGDKVILAPMPGLVVRIAVEPGQRIDAGDGVIVVEAMKMENELKAPSSGTVARIAVAAGQAVEKGSVLVVLE
jgi:acetyl/propionyl-CoA carboxylase alpha subunit